MEDNQLETSQYTQPAVELRVGSPHTSYYVPKSFLADYPKLLDLINHSRNIVKLPKVDKDVGHTLVHFLYCGKYQTLNPQGAIEAPDNRNEFRRGVLIYCTARSYEINGLVDHALNAMDQFGKDLTMASILDAACEVNARLPEDEVWLPKYLKAQLETAFEQDRGIFGRKEFMKHIGNNATWTQCLVKIMADILAEKSSHEPQEPDQPAAERLREEDFEILPCPRVNCGNADAENWPSPLSVGKEELTPDSEHFSVDELLTEVPLEPEMLAEEEKMRTPASGQTLASLNGRPIEADGHVIDNDGNVIATVISGNPKQMAKKHAKCDAHGNVVLGSKISGTVKLVLPEPEPKPEPEPEAEASPPPPVPEEPSAELKGHLLARLGGLEIGRFGDIHDHDKNVVGRLVAGDAQSLYNKFAVCTADGKVMANGEIVQNARVEIFQSKEPVEPEPEPEPELEVEAPLLPPPVVEESEQLIFASIDGKRLSKFGEIYNDDNNLVARHIKGSAGVLHKRGAYCDADGNVLIKGKKYKPAKIELVAPPSKTEDDLPPPRSDLESVEESSTCPERVDHMFGHGGSWKSCQKCRCSILEMANQL